MNCKERRDGRDAAAPPAHLSAGKAPATGTRPMQRLIWSILSLQHLPPPKPLSPCASCAFSFSSPSPFPHLSWINWAPWQTHEKHVEVTPLTPSNPSEQFPFLLIGLQILRTTRPFIRRTQAQLFAAGKSLSDAGSRTGCWVPLRGTRAPGAKPGCCPASCVPASAQRHHVDNLQEKNPPLILQAGQLVLGWCNMK